ncbi:MAG: hypothetical protein OM95_07065 [Bdellovibrio sp. ArHS]|uniref:hypothetical protein n=1 Tax=Bdellovibrio sp. ArHS TaxID=1569284 RepID=UPI000583E3FB|nr:hypothetical protein [Bdellovibrio sp. ArHS]KHD88869.1 MAG: hypothetical protein OM95_07065 [Bdellovibrio sp. ArHS]
MTQKLNRYDLTVYEVPFEGCQGDMAPSVDGKYVLFSDILPLIEALKFYGSVDTWISKEFDEKNNLIGWTQKKPNDVSIFPYSIGNSNGNFHCLGRKAREVLKKIGVIP